MTLLTLMLPPGTWTVTLGLGYIVALDEPPFNLHTSSLLSVLAHTLVALPFAQRAAGAGGVYVVDAGVRAGVPSDQAVSDREVGEF